MQIITRQSKIEDIPALRHIWRSVFGGGSEEKLFFSHYSDPKNCILIESNNNPASMGYLLPAGNITNGADSIPCAMIFALATLPEHRSKGYASEIVKSLVRTSHNRGYSAIILCPSDDSLFEYYVRNTEFQEMFYIHEKVISNIPTYDTRIELSETTPENYNEMRKNLLRDIPYIDMDIQGIKYQYQLSRLFRGGMFIYECSNFSACAVVERISDESVFIKELLVSQSFESNILSAIAASFPATKYILRTPVYNKLIPMPGVRRFGMIAASGDVLALLKSSSAFPWYGLAFD